ncbi:hypothetical protein [Bacillus weihaiensis]|uniref:hypothetical protein n=1 Tax=Bacillus weihaiensis TaxID=1547283 RepID=UPI00235567C3|nr:hypothetical protein [Bacillus weihaiensis]
MSLKNIEMQIALPRTHDAGKIQEQLNQRSQLTQDQLAHSLQKQVELKRTQVQAGNGNEKLKLKKEDASHDQQQQQQKKKREKDQLSDDATDHPYKGKNIDFFG